MDLPKVVSQGEWEQARQALLAQEKQATRARDALAAQRRRLPRQHVEKEYRFEGPDGAASLRDLFDGRRQLIVYHFMFEPGGEPCEGCSMVADNIGHLAHLHARDTTFVLTSPASRSEIDAYQARMGWTVPWFSTNRSSEFNDDLGNGTSFALNVFLRDGDDVFRTYKTDGRGVEALGSNWTFLDLTPLGRQEKWEDSPDGYPQTPPYEWWRRHDEY
jgi:predicted dithiol-disulfide oxidoreductase (DUF899 family)